MKKSDTWTTNFLQKEVFKKIFMVMKITVFILLLTIGSTFAKSLYSQNTRLTLHLENATIQQIFDEIQKKSEFIIFYKDDQVDLNLHSNIDVENATVDQILDQALKGTDLGYRIMDRQIVILTDKMKELPSLLKSETKGEQKKEISGTVKDSKGFTLPGVSVVVKGTTIGIITDIDGKFRLSVPTDAKTLVFSFVGMKSQEVEIAGKTNLNITMEEKTEGIEDVVVIGYGTQKRENLTGAVGTIKSTVFTDRPAAAASTSLQGTVAGLDVTLSPQTPGASAIIKIREVASWKGTSTPLFVIDGILRDQIAFDALNPADIDNISILKDAASASIYGMMAGNGVVLITTKNGGAHKAAISYAGSYTTSSPTTLPHLMNAYESANYTNKFFTAAGRNPQTDPNFFAPDELEYFKTHTYPPFNYLWKNPWNENHNLSISGGNEDISYYLSGSYVKQQGAFASSFDKYTLLAKLDGRIANGLNFHFELNGTWNKRSQPIWAYFQGDNTQMQWWDNALFTQPYFPLVINGKYTSNGQTNFASVLSGANGFEKPVNSFINPIFSLNYEIPGVKGLAVKSLVSFSSNNSYYRFFAYTPLDLYYFKTTGTYNHIMTDVVDTSRGINGAHRDEAQIGGMGGNSELLKDNWSKSTSYQINEMITYKRSFGLHNVEGLAAYEQIGSSGQFLNASVAGYPNLNYSEIDGGQGASDPNKRFLSGSQNMLNAQQSYFGRLDYNYDMRYLLGITYRADASYIFAPGHQWGYFPAVSAGWNISKESFFEPYTKYVDLLKLRGSYGTTGSNNTAPWQWQQNYTYNANPGVVLGYNPQNGISLGGTINPLITWEKNRNIDAGLDADIREGLLSLNIDYWHKKTYDILDSRIASLPSMVGAILPAVNYGQATAHGLEITLGHQGSIGEVKYHIGANWAYANNKFTLKDQALNVRDYQNQIGYPISGVMYGLVSEGIIRTQADLDKITAEHGANFTIYGKKPQLGMLLFKDIRGPLGTDTPDGKIDNNDQQRISLNGIPRINYGINLGVEWKGLELNLLFAGKAKYDVMLDSWARRSWNSIDNLTMWNDVWTPATPNAKLPSPVFNDWASSKDYEVPSTFWMRSGAYLRLKTAQLSYSLPAALLHGLQISSARFYLTGENLFSLDKLPPGFDPDLGGNYTLSPILRSFTAGLQVTF
ncbi:MAG: TonB-dependent receptor [Bacteroidia bacterium]|nr:TonB-dependent receptor [Bacteroidia bacterium]